MMRCLTRSYPVRRRLAPPSAEAQPRYNNGLPSVCAGVYLTRRPTESTWATAAGRALASTGWNYSAPNGSPATAILYGRYGSIADRLRDASATAPQPLPAQLRNQCATAFATAAQPPRNYPSDQTQPPQPSP